ncbi:MAG: ABC transporter substrate-binding protein [Desulfuromonadales bacterium]|nr:ABC transporter substrate-binding protein [Desulfuromonadales bacterium]
MNYPLLLLLFAFLLNVVASPVHAADFKIITDMDDRKIEVPVNPKKIVCQHGVSTEKIMILGKGASMTLMAMKPSPWAYRLYPEIRNLPLVSAPYSGDVEQMLKQKVDLVLYSPQPEETKKYAAVGIRTACGFSVRKRPRSLDDFEENFKRQVRFFGELLGPDAKPRAEKYCRYFDKKMKMIRSRTSKIALKERPTVYYGGRFGNQLFSQGNASVMHWDTEMAGGNYLPRIVDDNFIELHDEQLLVWNPDVIFISGWGSTLENFRNNPKWASLKAVRNGKVYVIPNGVFAWEYASGETIPFIIYMAKILHPDLFRDLDMKKELKTFYSEVYGKTVSDRDAERILQNLPPL